MPVKLLSSEDLLKQGKLADAVAALVRERGTVIFPEITRFLAPYMPVIGNVSMCLGLPKMNVVIWVGMTTEYCDLMDKLLNAKKIFLHPSDAMPYRVESAAPDLPVAKKAGPYASLRWVPACLRPEPIKQRKKHRKKSALLGVRDGTASSDRDFQHSPDRGGSRRGQALA